VYNIITGAATEEEAFLVYCESKKILKIDAFNLRKFHTKLSSLQSRIDVAERQSIRPQKTYEPSLDETYADATLDLPYGLGFPLVKVLEVHWESQEDCLQFSVNEFAYAAAGWNPLSETWSAS